MSMWQGWESWALLSAVFAALTAILAKAGVAEIDPDFATLVRTIVILLVSGALVGVLGKWQNPLTLPGTGVALLVLSGIATGLSWLCYFRALALGNASLVAPVDKLSVVLVAIFAAIFLGERPSARDWLAIGLITAGVLMLTLRG